jgi:hypothetical protein
MIWSSRGARLIWTVGRHRQRRARGTFSTGWRWLAALGSLGLALMACGGSPAALPKAAAMPTVSDTLTTETSSWAVQLPGCQFVASGYQVTANACFSAYKADQGTVKVDVRVAQAEQDALVGLALRHVSNGNHYVFGLALDGTTFNGDWVFASVVNGQGALIASGSDPAIQRSADGVNTLRVDFQGKHFGFWVNGAQVGEADDATLSGLGLLGMSAGGNSSALFSHFTFSCGGTCIFPGASPSA